MTKPKLDKESPSLTPHGDILDVPGKDQADKPAEKPGQAMTTSETTSASSRPPAGPGTGIPGQPSRPVPHPEPTDVPGETPEPEEPGQGQPIPPEL